MSNEMCPRIAVNFWTFLYIKGRRKQFKGVEFISFVFLWYLLKGFYLYFLSTKPRGHRLEMFKGYLREGLRDEITPGSKAKGVLRGYRGCFLNYARRKIGAGMIKYCLITVIVFVTWLQFRFERKQRIPVAENDYRGSKRLFEFQIACPTPVISVHRQN